ncbi:hypothetical protein CP532_5434 [Ophiocordyceps camponoti-leonardi (nom. inval.)]|nr:hypothetical protein CP532_5434 [Ophiocordyceps camponoti-leonardi (nom. inval.)]
MDYSQQQQQQPPPPQQQDGGTFHNQGQVEAQPQRRVEREDGWQHNICDCSPCESCLLAFCLPCILFGRTATRMRDPTMQSHSELNGDCIVFGLLHYFTGFAWVYNMVQRAEIRHKYGVRGNCCDDYCASYWCLCCAIIQQDKEVHRRQFPGGGGPVTDPYNADKERMQVPPPPPPPHPAAAAAASSSAPAYQPPQQPLMQAQDTGTIEQAPPMQEPPPPSKETRN